MKSLISVESNLQTFLQIKHNNCWSSTLSLAQGTCFCSIVSPRLYMCPSCFSAHALADNILYTPTHALTLRSQLWVRKQPYRWPNVWRMCAFHMLCVHKYGVCCLFRFPFLNCVVYMCYATWLFMGPNKPEPSWATLRSTTTHIVHSENKQNELSVL